MAEIKVSVIVPIYNVREYIERCARSLLGSSINDDIEFIFVNDATPDDSMDILHSVILDFPKRQGQIKILEHEKNMGLPAARNTGLANAIGKYIYHCDSDDYVEKNMLEMLVDTADNEDAEIVWCDWFLTYKHRERYMKQPSYSTSEEAVKGMLSGGMKYNVWNKLVRRSLYIDNHIIFPSGYGMGEDMTMIKLFSCAKKIAYLGRAFYHYVKMNANAFSQTYSEKHLLELQHNVQDVLKYLTARYGNSLKNEYEFFKLDVKYHFLISDDKNRYKLWQSWYPEANEYIGLNKSTSIRSNILQRLAVKGQFWLICIYYKLVYRVIYRMIFR